MRYNTNMNMKKYLCLCIFLSMPTMVLCQGFSNFGNRGFGNRNLLGGQGKTARDIKKEKAQKRAESSNTKAIKKAKAENLAKRVNIIGLAGYKFGEKCDEVFMQKLEKPSFTRYEYVTLESSSLHGIHAITLIAQDPAIQTVKQMQDEITRLSMVFSNKFSVKFTSEIQTISNETADWEPVGGKLYKRVISPATQIRCFRHEEFANCTVMFEGFQDLIANKITMSFKVVKKFQLQPLNGR